MLTAAAAVGLGLGAMVAAGVTVGVGAGSASAATQEPCDIYAAAGTPCVAAHSTTRALYAAYDGPLYQVRRASDNTTTNIYPLSAGGAANAATQNSFCSGTTCVITEIYDQSGNGNNLTDAPGGGAAGGPDGLANATAAPTTVEGQPVYGVYIAAGDGYRDDSTKNIATGNNPESEYAIFDGTHYNGGCCFDYGNAETNNDDDGDGTMEAIYFGNIKVWGYGTGNGPWIMADMENGLFSGSNAGYNANDPTTSYRFTTAMIEGGANQWAILGGNAQSGSLATDYSGVRPSGYNPMKKQGAIILGIGGDNSKGSAGTFYEGVMTTGYASAATEAAVQANIVAAGYGTAPVERQRGDRHDRGRRRQRRLRRQQQRQRHQRQQGADVGLRRQHRRAELDRQQQRHPHHRRRLPGHHRRQVHQRDADRVVDVQRRRQPAVGGGERRARQPDLRPMPRRSQRQHNQRDPAPDLRLLGRLQPEMDRALARQAPAPPRGPAAAMKRRLATG